MTSESTRGNTPDHDEQWDQLARYIAGESSAAEAAQIERWLAEEPRRRELLAALQRATASVELTAPADIDVEAALRRVSAQLDDVPVHELAQARSPRRPIWTSPLARAAALAAVLLGAGVIVWPTTRDTATSNFGTIADRTYAAPVGVVDSVRLADGTRVVLAPGSRLIAAAAFGSSTHEVDLTGEALFDVAPASARRFTVRTGLAVIRDLGTTFSVRSDPAQVRVVVTSGSVVLRDAASADSGTVLRAGDRAVLPRGGTISTERGGASPADLAWTYGRLVFDNATLAQVADELRRWYGIELQFADSSLA